MDSPSYGNDITFPLSFSFIPLKVHLEMTTTTTDYLIVGSGLTGAVLARLLVDSGKDVIVLDRRNHTGGNVFDETDPSSGIRIQTYGPHCFRTNSLGIWNFLKQYAEFYDYQLKLVTDVDGKLEAWPVTQEYLSRTIGNHWKPGFQGTPSNFEEASLSIMPKAIYEKFVKGYTQKQWGLLQSHLMQSWQNDSMSARTTTGD